MDSSQSGPQKLIFIDQQENTSRSPPGPQLWAIVLSLGGLYYIWTRILGRPLPSFLRETGGYRVRKGHSADEMAAARERQQQRLQLSVKKEETNVRGRNINLGNSTSKMNIQQQLNALQQSQAEKQKQKQQEEKKRKQRELYLRKKAEMEKAEEERRKDEELGPGWRYRQDPTVGNAVNSMNPQADSEGGYKPKTCTRKGG